MVIMAITIVLAIICIVFVYDFHSSCHQLNHENRPDDHDYEDLEYHDDAHQLAILAHPQSPISPSQKLPGGYQTFALPTIFVSFLSLLRRYINAYNTGVN